VSETSVHTDLLQSLEIITELGVKSVGVNLRELAVLNVLLSVEEPVGDLELAGVGNDGDDLVDLSLGELSSSSVGVDIGLLENQVGETSANTSDGGQGVHDLVLSVDVGVSNTEQLLEARLTDHERLITLQIMSIITFWKNMSSKEMYIVHIL